MADRLADLETRIETLARELTAVRNRVDRLEGEDALAPTDSARDEATESAVPQTALVAGAVGLVGRTFMALGGAYLLRAVTETGVVPPLAGAVAGLAYAGVWLVMADRAAARDRRMSAVFHGAASAMIAYPLTWETTARFGLMSHAAAAALIPFLVALGLAVAWRTRLSGIAWTHGLFGLATAAGLLQITHDLVPFTVALLLIALLVELTAMRDRWLALRWPTALVLDFAVLQTVLVALRRGGPPPGYPELPPQGVIFVGLALPVLYLGSVAVRTFMRKRDVRWFEIVQIAVALLVGFGGTLGVVRFTGRTTLAVGLFGLLLGAACYAAAFLSIDRREGRTRNFYVYATFAGFLTLAGTSLMLSPTLRALAWGTLGLVAAWLGGRYQRITLRIHGVVYLAMAAGASGLLRQAGEGLLAEGAGSWSDVAPLGLVVGTVLLASYTVLARTSRPDARWSELVPQVGAAGLAAAIAAGLTARALGVLLAEAPGPDVDLAYLATSRTAAVAGVAVLLAWAGRRWARPELAWLVYPLLAFGGLRLVLEDLSHGRPGSLFISFALYGGALFATPRLMRKSEDHEVEK